MPFGVISKRYRRQMHAKKRQEILQDLDLVFTEQRVRIMERETLARRRFTDEPYPVALDSVYKTPLRREEFDVEVRS